MAGETAGRGGAGAGEAAATCCSRTDEASDSFSGSAGVSSTVECLPVVHGGMVRNSSKVRTRVLQHFQPADHLSDRGPHLQLRIRATGFFATPRSLPDLPF